MRATLPSQVMPTSKPARPPAAVETRLAKTNPIATPAIAAGHRTAPDVGKPPSAHAQNKLGASVPGQIEGSQPAITRPSGPSDSSAASPSFDSIGPRSRFPPPKSTKKPARKASATTRDTGRSFKERGGALKSIRSLEDDGTRGRVNGSMDMGRLLLNRQAV